jgi:hypothetical protein
MIRVSYRRDGDQWVGLLKVGKTTLVECGHCHTNRDVTTAAGGEAAQVCARMILAGARNPATAEHTAQRYRTAYLVLTTGAGFAHPADLIDKVKADGAARATAYLALVDQVRAHPELTTEAATPATPATEPAAVGELPSWMQ